MAIFRSFFDLIPGEPCTQRHSSGVGSKVYTLLGRTLKINDHTALHQKAHGRANLNSMGTALCAFFCFCFTICLFLFCLIVFILETLDQFLACTMAHCTRHRD